MKINIKEKKKKKEKNKNKIPTIRGGLHIVIKFSTNIIFNFFNIFILIYLKNEKLKDKFQELISKIFIYLAIYLQQQARMDQSSLGNDLKNTFNLKLFLKKKTIN